MTLTRNQALDLDVNYFEKEDESSRTENLHWEISIMKFFEEKAANENSFLSFRYHMSLSDKVHFYFFHIVLILNVNNIKVCVVNYRSVILIKLLLSYCIIIRNFLLFSTKKSQIPLSEIFAFPKKHFLTNRVNWV